MIAPPNMLGLDLTELGNARRIAKKFGHELRFVKAWRSWLVWDNARWSRDEVGIEMSAAKELVSDLYAEAAELAKKASTDCDERVAEQARMILAWAKSSSKRSTLAASAALAETEKPIAAWASAFDADPWLLNVPNGTIDLRTGNLRPHRQEDFITMLAPVAYDPAATCPRWDAFIDWALPDPATRSWFWRYVGHCLTGDVGSQIITFLHGAGANGKSTATGVIKHVLGDYAVQGSPALLMAIERGNGEELARRQRAVVKGKRFVLVQELEAGRYLNESQVKQLTGGDTITAARLYENEAEIMPTHKLAVATNYKPVVRGSDHAIWRRIMLVPFPSRVTDDQKDPALQEKLIAEAPGILAWMVRGCLAWQRDGLAPSKLMRAATEGYRKDEDRLGEFLDDFTEPGEAALSDPLYKRYQRWAEDRGETVWTQRAFTNALVERGFPADRATVNGRRGRAIRGLALRSGV